MRVFTAGMKVPHARGKKKVVPEMCGKLKHQRTSRHQPTPPTSLIFFLPYDQQKQMQMESSNLKFLR